MSFIIIWTYEQVFIYEHMNKWTYEQMNIWTSIHIWTYEQMNKWTYEHMNKYSYMKNFTNVNENAYQLQLWKISQSFIIFIVKNFTMKVNPAYICEKIHNESILHESDIHASAFRNPFHCEKIHKKNRNVFHCEKNHNEKQIICKRLHCEKNHIESVFISNCWKRFHMWFFSQL